MAYLPSLDRFDYVVVGVSLVLLFFAYVIYPSHIVQVGTWFLVFTIDVGWMAHFLKRWMFEGDT